MDCPKCIGKLKPLRIKKYGVEYMHAKPQVGRGAGTMITATIRSQKKTAALVLDKCWVCRGIWFDKAELRKLQREKSSRKTIGSYINDPKIYKQLNEKGGLCPRCKVPMRRITGKIGGRNITVDACIKCRGIWLDGGEVNYFLKGREKKWLESVERLFWWNWFKYDAGDKFRELNE